MKETKQSKNIQKQMNDRQRKVRKQFPLQTKETMLSRFKQMNIGVPLPQRILQEPGAQPQPVPEYQFTRQVPTGVPRNEAYYIDGRPQQYVGYPQAVYNDESSYVYGDLDSYIVEPESVNFTGPIVPQQNLRRISYGRYDDMDTRPGYGSRLRSRVSMFEDSSQIQGKPKRADDVPRDNRTSIASASRRKENTAEAGSPDSGDSKSVEKTPKRSGTQPSDAQKHSNGFDNPNKQPPQSDYDPRKDSTESSKEAAELCSHDKTTAKPSSEDIVETRPASQDTAAAEPQSPKDTASAKPPFQDKPSGKSMFSTIQTTLDSSKTDSNKEQTTAPPCLPGTVDSASEGVRKKNNSSQAESSVDAAAHSSEQPKEGTTQTLSVPYSQMYKSSLTPELYGKSMVPKQPVRPLDQIKNIICCCLVAKEEQPEHLSPNTPRQDSPQPPSDTSPAKENPPLEWTETEKSATEEGHKDSKSESHEESKSETPKESKSENQEESKSEEDQQNSKKEQSAEKTVISVDLVPQETEEGTDAYDTLTDPIEDDITSGSNDSFISSEVYDEEKSSDLEATEHEEDNESDSANDEDDEVPSLPGF